jgi:hypothetical protein
MYGRGGVKVCSKAAIGLGYNGKQSFLFQCITTNSGGVDSSVLIAIRPTILPATSVAYNPADPHLDLSSEQSFPSISEPDVVIEWGEEPTIELFDVQLNFDSMLQSMYYQIFNRCQSHPTHLVTEFTCKPLSTIHLSNARLSHISFICTPPMQSKSNPQGDRPAIAEESDRGRIYLCASSLDFGDCKQMKSSHVCLAHQPSSVPMPDSSTPKSELVIHSLSRINLPGKPPWVN